MKTLAELKTAYPELTAQLESEAKASVAKPAEAQLGMTKDAIDAKVAEAAKEGMEAERKRAADIHALCAEAGHTEADKLIREGKTVEEVRGVLFEALCKNRKAPAGDESNGDNLGEGNDPDKKFKKEYEAHRPQYMQQSISEAAYIKSRRIDEGLDVITPGSKK